MEEIDLKELLTMFWNKKILLIILVLISAVLGYIYTTNFVTPMYTSSTTIVLASPNKNTSLDTTITATDVTMNSKLVSTYSELVKSKNVLRKVISNLGETIDEDELRKNIKVSSVDDTELIKVAVTTKEPERAAKIANEIANVFIGMVKDIYNIENVQVVDKAETETKPSNINHKKDIAIFACIGLIIGVGYVLLENMLDTTVKNAEEIEREFGIPVLATVPQVSNFTNQKGGSR